MTESAGPRLRTRRPLAPRRSGGALHVPRSLEPDTAPIVAAVDNCPASRAATRDAVRPARAMRLSVVFVTCAAARG
jgi:hypothetical protein